MKRKPNCIDQVSDESLRANLLMVYQEATARQVRDGRGWYRRANQIATGLAGEHGLETWQAAGILAALSPAVDWGRNVKDAATLCAASPGATLRLSTYGANVAKAQRILAGEHPDAVLGGRKVRAFYASIVDPRTSREVCVDRHAVAAALLEVGGVEVAAAHARALEAVGAYDRIAAAYVDTADSLGIPPHAAQATVWLAWQAWKVRQLDASGRRVHYTLRREAR
jgi:hypothetical protein